MELRVEVTYEHRKVKVESLFNGIPGLRISYPYFNCDIIRFDEALSIIIIFCVILFIEYKAINTLG